MVRQSIFYLENLIGAWDTELWDAKKTRTQVTRDSVGAPEGAVCHETP
jgi:hypothetical protein